MTELAELLPTFITIPAGQFRMGTRESELSDLARRYGGTRESYRAESPQHRVGLPAFAIAATPVTIALYAAFAAATGVRAPRGEAHLPVVDVSWHEAAALCAWINATGRVPERAMPSRGLATIRLPTEAEWERAARGEDGRTFPWGEGFDPDLANTREGERATSSPVGAYPRGASPCGALDMAGNIWEWTSSLDQRYPYAADDGREHPQAAGRRILRGGCYANPHGFARCACRFRLPPDTRNNFIGFRLAHSLR
jgi:formylglycine-generating enzyme required for sulfatase activity